MTTPNHTPRRKGRRRDDRGSASGELVAMVPVVLLILGFAVMVGRIATTQQDVTSAARDAARAASLRQHPTNAEADATATAQRTLAGRSVTCADLNIAVDTTQHRPGGEVTTTVTCHINLSDIAALGLPGTKTVTATATAVIDTYRGG